MDDDVIIVEGMFLMFFFQLLSDSTETLGSIKKTVFFFLPKVLTMYLIR